MVHESSAKPWRRILGLICLALVVCLWTTSSFLSSSIMADNTYSKPYLITYLNTSFFSLTLIPFFIQRWRAPKLLVDHERRLSRPSHDSDGDHASRTRLLYTGEEEIDEGLVEMSSSLELPAQAPGPKDLASAPLSIRETFILSAKFCFFWFLANWFNSASFQFTTVASSTILTSTSSVFVLLFGAIMGVERFTFRKLAGVLASLSGIILISYVDSKERPIDDPGRGSFPYMTAGEIVLGDALALMSAIMFGVYATGLTKAVGDESRVDMTLFFGFVGLTSTACLWPLFPILHFMDVETFELPSTKFVWTIILVNASISLISDVSWGYAVLLTSPLVVTVGLTLTIPLSLIGQMIISNQVSPPLYWLGAGIVIAAFVFINYESRTTIPPPSQQDQPDE